MKCPRGLTSIDIGSDECTIPDGLIHHWALSTYQSDTLVWPDRIGRADMTGYSIGETVIQHNSKKAITISAGGLLNTAALTTPISYRTLSWWVRIKDMSQTGGGFGISSTFWDAQFESIVWNGRQPDEGWFFGSSGWSRSGPEQHFLSATAINTWQMVTAVYGTDYIMYVNGNELFRFENPNYLQTYNAHMFFIGPRAKYVYGGITEGYINADVGDVMVCYSILMLILFFINDNSDFDNEYRYGIMSSQLVMYKLCINRCGSPISRIPMHP